jgi:hypothetical protein
MKYCEENQYHPKLVCNKGNMLLNEIKMPLTNNKAYNLQFEFNNLNTYKVNSDLLLTTQLYELLEKVNVDLIEKIHILNVLNERETDICILLKQIAKEVGIKQKYILFRSTKYLNKLNNNITYYNKDLIYDHKDLIDNYLNNIKLDNNKYEPLIFNFGKTVISVVPEIVLPSANNEHEDENENENEDNKFIHVKFSIDFQISIADDLPIYMNNLIGLMFKKMFYNVKSFIDNLNL